MANKVEKDDLLMEKIVSLCKRRGFVFPGSEIYGGLAGTYDYGPLGALLKRNIEKSWIKYFVEFKDNMCLIDSSILMHPKVWEASGHVENFADPVVKCDSCGKKYRLDSLINEKEYFDKIKEFQEKFIPELLRVRLANLDKIPKEFNTFKFFVQDIKSIDDINKQLVLAEKFLGSFPVTYLSRVSETKCPDCNKVLWSEGSNFNLMLETKMGASEETATKTYLRPEEAQGIFVNFKNVLQSLSPKVPFGIAQIGKAFRNEITPRDFTYRVREFEIMEFEYFIHPNDPWEAYFDNFLLEQKDWLSKIGIDVKKLHALEHPENARAHYSKKTVDLEFEYPFGTKELTGLSHRGDFDLKRHQEFSGEKMEMLNDETGEKFIPHVIEPTVSLERTVLALLLSSYKEDGEGDDKRVYLKFPPSVAPYKACVSPLLKNKPELITYAKKVHSDLKKEFGWVVWDDNGNIGKRYRRQDEIGTPFCIVIDFDTLEDNTVTVRDRDTGNQERIKVAELIGFIKNKLN